MVFTLLKKYNKYDMEYSYKTKVLTLYKPISVREFLELKWEICINKLDVKDIVITNRYIVAKKRF